MPNIIDLVDDIYFPSTFIHNSSNNHTIEVYQFREFYFFYVYPVILFFAAFQSLICTIVLAQKELRSSGPFFQYSLVNAINSTVGTFLAAFLFLINCGSLCDTSYTYASELYKILAVYFLVSSLYFQNSLIQIAISCHLYFNLIQKWKRFTELSPTRVVLASSFFSILYGLFFASSFRISSVWTSDMDDELFYAHFNPNDKIHVYISIFLVAISNQVVLIILVVINALVFDQVRQVKIYFSRSING